MTVISLLQAYAQRIRDLLRRANAGVPEPALAPAFQQLLEGLILILPVRQGLMVLQDRNPGVGRPDIALIRQGAPPRAFVELKGPAKPADPSRWRDPHDKRQFERFKELPCWASCNFAELRLFDRTEELGTAAVVPEVTLRRDRDDVRANRSIAEHDAAPPLAFSRKTF
jgi:hypothetical protein